MTATTDSVQQLYIAYFNRPADPIGLQYWANQLTAKTQTLESIANNFARQTEYSSNFTGLTSAQIVNTIYQNLFGHAADVAGLQYWANQLEAGTQTIGKIALSISLGAIGSDLVAVQSKVQAATSFTQVIQQSTDDIINYTGGALTAAKTFLSRVVDGTTLATETAPATLNATVTSVLSNGGSPGQTYALTTGIDTLVGTAGNDVFNATVGSNKTLSALDQIDGQGGRNTLNIADDTGGNVNFSGVVAKNIQTINVRSFALGNLDLTTSTGLSGVTLLNTTSLTGGDAITVGSGTAVNATNTVGAVTVTGGDSAVTVSAATNATINGKSSTQTVSAAGAVTLSGATGAITVTDSAQGANNIGINGGTSVSLNVTQATTGANTITIGNSKAPTGAVTIVANEGPAASGTFTGGAITVNGGSTVNVTINATQPLATASASPGTNNLITTQSAVTVNGSANTTSVTVNQTAAATAAASVTAVAGVTETGSAVFVALTAGETLTVADLTFTAGTAGTTAAQTAAAFANLQDGALQGNSTLGTYSGAISGWSTGAATSATVVFSSTAAGPVANLSTTVGGTGTAPTITEVDGVTAVKASGTGGIAGGAVTITDVNYGTATAGTIATVTESAYATGSISSDALTSLSLANSTGQTVSVNNHTATTLGLTVNKLGAASALNLDAVAATYKTLNVTTTGAASTLNVTGAAVTALTVAGTQSLNLTGSTFTALKTVAVSGSAGITLNASGAAVTDVNASATSGNNTVTINAVNATYEGGTGADNVTLSAIAPTKTIALGDGNDTLTLFSGTTAVTSTITGGNGTDTLVFVAADAVTASGSAAFAAKVTGFEVLGLTDGTGAQTVHVDTLGGYNSVSTGAEAAGGVLTLDGFTSGGTLTLTGASTGNYVVSGTAFATPTTDVFNIGVSAGSSISAGTVTANKVETFNLSSVDTNTAHAAGTNTNSLTVVGDSVTKLVITGNANLNLTSANTTVTSVNASALTGALTYTAAGTVAEVVTGGSGDDSLTASTGSVADTLIGGAGDDTLTSNQGLSTLTGGAGADTFVIVASANSSSYSTITDATVGDSIQFGSATSFGAVKITLAATAVFQDYVNAAVHSSAIGGINWFQYQGDTYVVENNTANQESAFVNGTDSIVKLTGLVDLSHTSLNTTSGTLLIG